MTHAFLSNFPDPPKLQLASWLGPSGISRGCSRRCRRIDIRTGIISTCNQRCSLFFFDYSLEKIAYSHQRTVYCNQLQFALIIHDITVPFSNECLFFFFFFLIQIVPLSITICLAIFSPFLSFPIHAFHGRRFCIRNLCSRNVRCRSKMISSICAVGF